MKTTENFGWVPRTHGRGLIWVFPLLSEIIQRKKSKRKIHKFHFQWLQETQIYLKTANYMSCPKQVRPMETVRKLPGKWWIGIKKDGEGGWHQLWWISEKPVSVHFWKGRIPSWMATAGSKDERRVTSLFQFVWTFPSFSTKSPMS